MIDRSALVRDTFESGKSFEKKEVWLVKCAECGKVYGNDKGVILFSNIEKALNTIAESKDWWIVRDYGIKVLCYDCVQKFREKMEDEVSGDVMMLA